MWANKKGKYLTGEEINWYLEQKLSYVVDTNEEAEIVLIDFDTIMDFEEAEEYVLISMLAERFLKEDLGALSPLVLSSFIEAMRVEKLNWRYVNPQDIIKNVVDTINQGGEECE